MTHESRQHQGALPLWHGSRGIRNLAIVCVLAVLCALGAWRFAETAVIVPTCTAYANAHGVTYNGYESSGVRQDTGTNCSFTQADGNTTEESLQGMVPFFTDVLVRFALDFEISIPGFIVLFVLIWTGCYRIFGPQQTES